MRHAVPVRDHRAFRERGRAGGVEQREEIVGRRRGEWRHRGFCAGVHHVAKSHASGIVVLSVDDHGSERRKPFAAELAGHSVANFGRDGVERLEVVGISQVLVGMNGCRGGRPAMPAFSERWGVWGAMAGASARLSGPPTSLIGEDQGGGVRLRQDVRELVGLVARVERHDDGAEPGARLLGDEPGRPVRHPDRDIVPGRDAQRGESARQGRGALAERRVGDALVGRDDRVAIGIPGGDHVEHLAHGRVEEGIRLHAAATRR